MTEGETRIGCNGSGKSVACAKSGCKDVIKPRDLSVPRLRHAGRQLQSISVSQHFQVCVSVTAQCWRKKCNPKFLW